MLTTDTISSSMTGSPACDPACEPAVTMAQFEVGAIQAVVGGPSTEVGRTRVFPSTGMPCSNRIRERLSGIIVAAVTIFPVALVVVWPSFAEIAQWSAA
ncbi:hypothetical protein AA12467_2312 [Gluconobacter sphaericus NBRC 12467]|nr:hypothetical protein AA12467_2312 [Gluconobacter sphaericus NBRC 12467]